ncbi:MAG TPA: DegT/DnrJ/EryC1/StrS family aminotransferase, partial [Acidimicrobiales bacterium]|nr:DegT/DnrJ/EryC1/StrS family aminotransferase [Acidimicrobiales bacterium]
SQASHGEEEIAAVVDVLRGGPQAMRIGPKVTEMERRVAQLFGKQQGLMCNSGSSAILLAFALLDLKPGSQVITSPLTFSTDVSALVHAGLVPVFVDVEPDTFNADVSRLEELIGERTRAIFLPNLIGNAPDWDAVRQIADRHGLAVVEDSCDALGATLRGTPTGTRADISVTSFAMSHIITCAGNGGMVLLDDGSLRDRGLMLRRWGRRSEPHLFGSQAARTGRVFREDLDGIPYDNDFIFDVQPWNLEPSELGAAFGLVQLDRLGEFHGRRQKNFDAYTRFLTEHPDVFVPPRQLDGLDTAWLCYPFLVAEGAPFERPDLQEYLESVNIDTRTVWSGNITRHPMMHGVEYRVPDDGLPNADRVMRQGMLLPCSHGLTDEELDYVCEHLSRFMEDHAG